MKKIFFLASIIFVLNYSYSLQAKDVLPDMAIYSGSFDPPTLAHKAIVTKALSIGIKKIYIILNTYGKKTFKASPKERLAMLNLMFANMQDRVKISEQHHLRKQKDYMFIKNMLNQPVALITGYDSYLRGKQIPTKNKILFDKLIVIQRGKIDSNRIINDKNVWLLNISDEYSNISSTNLRTQINTTKINTNQIDKSVLNYILKNKLYSLSSKNKKNKQQFYQDFYIFLGKLVKKDLPIPEFQADLSVNAWKSLFYKYYHDHKLNKNNCFRSYIDYAAHE